MCVQLDRLSNTTWKCISFKIRGSAYIFLAFTPGNNWLNNLFLVFKLPLALAHFFLTSYGI